MTANNDNRSLTNAKEIRRWILYPDADWISRCEMHPIQRPLHVRKAFLQTTKVIRAGSHSETDAVNDAGEAYVRLGHHVNVGSHSGCNLFQLAFTEVGHGPPGARINQREYLLAHMSVSAF